MRVQIKSWMSLIQIKPSLHQHFTTLLLGINLGAITFCLPCKARIRANGTIFVDTIDIEATLIAFDSKGQQLAEFKQKINTEKNIGFNDPEYYMLSGIGERTQVVRGLLEQYENYLKTTKKGALQ